MAGKNRNAATTAKKLIKQEHRPSLPHGTCVDHSLTHWFVDQTNHHARLRHLFPEFNPTTLYTTLDSCGGDFIRTVDTLINFRARGFSRTAGSHPINPTFFIVEHDDNNASNAKVQSLVLSAQTVRRNLAQTTTKQETNLA
jgi:hypothetical protein